MSKSKEAFVTNNKIGEEKHKECVIETFYKLDKPSQLAELSFKREECNSFLRWGRYRGSLRIYINRYKSDNKSLKK